jgi:hydroxymethylpyrimidine pyrophosphatase-like HAD family hydrolase
MGQVQAVVSDLDGTFWSGQAVVHPTTLAAVAELRARDVKLLFATGRRYASAQRALDPLGLAGPAVLMSGAVGADLRTGEEWHRQAFSPKTGQAVLDAFVSQGLAPVVYVGDDRTDTVITVGCSTSPTHRATLGPPDPIGLEPEITAGRVVGFGVCGIDQAFTPALEAVAEQIRGTAQGWLGPDHVMGGWTLMVGPGGISKVSAISGWCGTHGLTPDQVLAVGDGSNDLEMLAWAGTSVAVVGGVTAANGSDHVIDRPQDGGWARLLDLL